MLHCNMVGVAYKLHCNMVGVAYKLHCNMVGVAYKLYCNMVGVAFKLHCNKNQHYVHLKGNGDTICVLNEMVTMGYQILLLLQQ